MKKANAITRTNSRNMIWYTNLRSIWREMIEHTREFWKLTYKFQQLLETLKPQIGTSEDYTKIKPISVQFELLEWEFSSVFGMEYSELISALKLMTTPRIKKTPNSLTKRLTEFLVGLEITTMESEVTLALNRIDVQLITISSTVSLTRMMTNTNDHLTTIVALVDVTLTSFKDCIAAIEKFKPNLVKLSVEMIRALGAIPIFKVERDFTKLYDESLAMRRQKSIRFGSKQWFNNFVSASEKIETMMLALFQIFAIPPRIIEPLSDLKQSRYAAQHYADIELKWNYSINTLHFLYERLWGIYGGDVKILMRKIRNMKTVPPPTVKQTERLNNLFELFNSSPEVRNSFWESERKLYNILDKIWKMAYATSPTEIPENLRYFEINCEQINELSIEYNRLVDYFVNRFRGLATEWDLIFTPNTSVKR